MNGVLILNKPAGITSHDAVHRVRKIVQEKSVGHLGTLDPMATGVLPLVLGKMTRLAQFYTGAQKAYEGTIRFGVETDTYDAQGTPVGEGRAVALTLEQVSDAAAQFRGKLKQTPPPFSAKKVEGVPAYKLARKKQIVELQPVEVEISEFEISTMEGSDVQFRARVSSGTYMRSIAHEMGRALGTGAHLAALTRTAVGEFTLEDAVTLEELQRATQGGAVDTACVHPRKLLPELPCVAATEENVGMIRHGRAVNLPELSRAKLVKVFRGQRELICIAARIAGTLFQPKIVLLE